MYAIPMIVVVAASAMPASDGKHRRPHWCPFCDLTARDIATEIAQLTNSEPSPRHAATVSKEA